MLLSEIESYNGISHKNSLFYDILKRWKIAIGREEKQYTVIGHIGKFEVRGIKGMVNGLMCWDLMVVDPNVKSYVAGVDLTGFGRKARSWQVDRVGVANKYQGMNLSVKIYEWLIKEQNLILLTGMSQTAGGRSIWERLASIPGIFIFGYDINKKESFQVDQKDLFNEDVYSDELTKERDELQNEYTRIENQLDNLNPDTTREYEIQKLEKTLSILNKQIITLDIAIEKAEVYLRLVAMKTK
jgi:hypothetical protein